MNERIRSAMLMAKILKYDPITMERCEELDPEKFAQLIVRECVKVMYDNAIERKVPPDIKQTPTHYAIAVLEHFGVDK